MDEFGEVLPLLIFLGHMTLMNTVSKKVVPNMSSFKNELDIIIILNFNKCIFCDDLFRL